MEIMDVILGDTLGLWILSFIQVLVNLRSEERGVNWTARISFKTFHLLQFFSSLKNNVLNSFLAESYTRRSIPLPCLESSSQKQPKETYHSTKTVSRGETDNLALSNSAPKSTGHNSMLEKNNKWWTALHWVRFRSKMDSTKVNSDGHEHHPITCPAERL